MWWGLPGGDVVFDVEPEEYFAGDDPVVVCGLGKRRCAVAVVVKTAYADFKSVCISVAE